MTPGTAIARVATAFVGLCAARHAVLLGASLLPRRNERVSADELPDVSLVIAARNEAGRVRRMLESLDATDYPPEKLSVTFVDDCSDDGTRGILEEWSARAPNRRVVGLDTRVGKGAALNAGLAATGPSDVIAIADADLRLEPLALRKLVVNLDGDVAAAVGYLAPENALETPVATYAAVESWVHQLITSAGKDRLGLNPPTLGFSAYRRPTLEAIGMFSAISGEDVASTVALTRAGWLTRFAREAVAHNLVATDLRSYWSQHLRWAQNAIDIARIPGPRIGSTRRRVENAFAATGYLDRVVLPICAVAALNRRVSARPLLGYLLVRLVEVSVATAKAERIGVAPRSLLSTAIMFPVDIAASVSAAGLYVRRRRPSWRDTRPDRPARL